MRPLATATKAARADALKQPQLYSSDLGPPRPRGARLRRERGQARPLPRSGSNRNAGGVGVDVPSGTKGPGGLDHQQMWPCMRLVGGGIDEDDDPRDDSSCTFR